VAVAPFPSRAAAAPSSLLSRVVEHYHRTFCQRPDAQEYLGKRGLRDADLLKAFKVGYADGSLKTLVAENKDLKAQLVELGVLTKDGRELLGGCVVVPIPDPKTGEWTNLYGRGMRTDRHCYLPGPLRGVLNYQAARSSSEIVIAESIIDALSFHQAGVFTAIPIYGTNGFTDDHLDLITRAHVRRVILALDGDMAGRKATSALKEKLQGLGVDVRVMPYPPHVKDPNEMLVSVNGDAGAVFRKCLDEAEPRPVPEVALKPAPASTSAAGGDAPATEGGLVVRQGERTYQAKVASLATPDRLRAVLRVESSKGFHVDVVDLFAARSRREYSKRAAAKLGADAAALEDELLSVLTRLEQLRGEQAKASGDVKPEVPPMTEAERAQALAYLKRKDLLDQIARDVDTLGYVGEDTNTRLLYLVAVSRKLADPLSAVILSQSGAGKSGASDAIERLTPPEDVVFVTRLTPQSLYYAGSEELNGKLVVIEERHGSAEADYSLRALQSRKKLSVMAPIKDPHTGNMKSKRFLVEARAAFIEATTRPDINHENSTRSFELTMDESPEQTARIHERQRLMKTEWGLRIRAEGQTICRLHWNAQRLLEALPVVIPYADKLTFPTTWMRTRRDHARFLNLIEVSAFLHQHQRERKNGAVVASVEDYEVAFTLSRAVLEGTLSDLKKPLRDALARIRALAGDTERTISRREIREALSLPDSTVRGWLSELVELEYLEADQSRGGAGKATRYRLVDKGEAQQIVLGLMTPAELSKRLGAR
jgi:DNA primase